ncbi:MAG: hypothetical protein ABI626_08395 [Sphingomicrobium sp.]
MKALILIPLAGLLGGCVVGTVAKTAVAVVTLPVKVASAGVDAVTTSQSEADQKRGRELRKADEKRARDEREAAKKAAQHPPDE